MTFLQDNQLLVFTAAVFAIVFLGALAVSASMARSARMHSRLGKAKAFSPARQGERARHRPLQDFIARSVDEKVFRLDDTARGELRRELIRAGYFGRNAVPLYLTVRIACIVAVPLVGWFYITALSDHLPMALRMALLAVFVMIGFYGPKSFISFRQRSLQQKYRDSFPDMMDVLVVCVDAGLSLESAIERVAREIGTSNPELGVNLSLVGMEMRAGRGTMQSLQTLADRLGIDEAQSLATLLRQSSELGTSISESLRVYGEEMRDKRMSRAEEKANALPVKLTIPLALFIFPVILIVILVPVVVRVLEVSLG
jgi:tight adherence protein C